ncbi:MAG TPA: gamma-glutamyltransferase family protein [Candidatus Limnocylindria bacterium]|nr:gamma-glutamyltransferase family protein [Candidatus Limnocylindria bacterium]
MDERSASGMVVAPHPAASEAGVAALRAGGNAVDAAVAANAVLAVVYGNACGIGGDAFALIWWPPERRLHAYNGSGRSPAGLTIEHVRAEGHASMPARGPLPITVPGCVDAWAAMLDRFGRRSLADAVLTAADLADDGYELTGITANAIARSADLFDEAARAVFLPAGRAPEPGHRLRQPLLAATLRGVAAGGREAFYRGEIGVEIARAVQAAGGVLSGDDLAAHRGDWVEPVSTEYRGVRVATTPPNSQGITALIALNVLAALRADGWPGLPADSPLAADAPLDPERLHAQLEAIKVAWSERDRCVTDPDRAICDTAALLTWDHAARLAARLDRRRAGRFLPTDQLGGGTVYLTAADAEGCMVSLIESNYMGFGSGVMGGSTGVMLQNRGAYFRLDPGDPNHLAPRARTLHTLMPAMLLRDGEPWISLGAMGGDGQPQTLVQLVNALVDDGLEPQAAVDRPRFVAEVEAPGRPLRDVAIEADGAGDEALVALAGRGHRARLVEPRTPLMGWAQVIRREPDGSYVGGADPRADSAAVAL